MPSPITEHLAPQGPIVSGIRSRFPSAMAITIRQIQACDVQGFRDCLDAVARERCYLAQVEAPPMEKVQAFITSSVTDDAAQFVAIDHNRVVGWCDIFAHWAYALQHTGGLGMGILLSHRGQGIGERLLRATLAKAATKGITRVTLEARQDNMRAISLYERVGFQHEAVKRNALRFDGKYYDAVQMVLLHDED
jgi:putative acetyltransferase